MALPPASASPFASLLLGGGAADAEAVATAGAAAAASSAASSGGIAVPPPLGDPSASVSLLDLHGRMSELFADAITLYT